MYQRILVPTDGSDITLKAVDTAIGLAKALGAQVQTISVKEPFPYSAMSEMQPTPPQEFFDAQERIANQRVQAVVTACAAACRARRTPWKRCTPGRPSSTTRQPSNATCS